MKPNFKENLEKRNALIQEMRKAKDFDTINNIIELWHASGPVDAIQWHDLQRNFRFYKLKALEKLVKPTSNPIH